MLAWPNIFYPHRLLRPEQLLRQPEFSVHIAGKGVLTVVAVKISSSFDFAPFVDLDVPLSSAEQPSDSQVPPFHIIVASSMSLRGGTVHIRSHLLWVHVIAS